MGKALAGFPGAVRFDIDCLGVSGATEKGHIGVMEKSPHTDPHCLTDAPGEKARVALFGPAVGCQRVWGEKHSGSLLALTGAIGFAVKLRKKSGQGDVAPRHDVAHLPALNLGNRGLWNACLAGDVCLSEPVGSYGFEEVLCCAHKYSLWTILTQLSRICNGD